MTKGAILFTFLDVAPAAGEDDFVVSVPSGIESKEALLWSIAKAGKFPNYFGGNWDALQDCLGDFSWVRQRRILVKHRDLPLSNRKDELRIYLEVLRDAKSDWDAAIKRPPVRPPNGDPYVTHELVVIFPSTAHRTIDELISEI